ncbi:MAG: nucleotidyltransferase domain-containing protein [Lachnospiraceae bacterium]|nr:nucleotidyltransferase domain-containing protein [Lachnospiraceae bacterium]
MGDDMVQSIATIREKTIPIVKKYGVKRIYLFGSYARGEAHDESDIDFYMEKGRLRSLIQYFSLVNDLEKTFDCHVDLISKNISDQEFITSIEKEGILLYEE